MQLVSTDFGWLLQMNEGRIQRIEVDFRLGLHLSDKAETASLYIEAPCLVRSEGQESRLVPGVPSTLAPVLALFNAEVANVSIQRMGRLTATLRDGRSLEVQPDEEFEAWQVGVMNGCLLVCPPGGEVAVFQQRGAEGGEYE